MALRLLSGGVAWPANVRTNFEKSRCWLRWALRASCRFARILTVYSLASARGKNLLHVHQQPLAKPIWSQANAANIEALVVQPENGLSLAPC